MKLLIVDDSNMMRRAIARYVGEDRFSEILTAENGREAIAVFSEALPEIVTLDITMPEIDGLTCLKALLEINAEAQILIVSALADRATAIEALKRGAQGFLCKPFTSEELNEALSELFEEA